MNINFDAVPVILAIGFVFFLVGGEKWLEEKIRALKLDNDRKEQELKKSKDEPLSKGGAE